MQRCSVFPLSRETLRQRVCRPFMVFFFLFLFWLEQNQPLANSPKFPLFANSTKCSIPVLQMFSVCLEAGVAAKYVLHISVRLMGKCFIWFGFFFSFSLLGMQTCSIAIYPAAVRRDVLIFSESFDLARCVFKCGNLRHWFMAFCKRPWLLLFISLGILLINVKQIKVFLSFIVSRSCHEINVLNEIIQKLSSRSRQLLFILFPAKPNWEMDHFEFASQIWTCCKNRN